MSTHISQFSYQPTRQPILYKHTEKQMAGGSQRVGLAICFRRPCRLPRRQLCLLGVAAWCSSLSELVKLCIFRILEHLGSLNCLCAEICANFSENAELLQFYDT